MPTVDQLAAILRQWQYAEADMDADLLKDSKAKRDAALWEIKQEGKNHACDKQTVAGKVNHQ